MAKAEISIPSNKSAFDRRGSSLIEHVHRIRTANSKRQFIPWWGNTDEEKSLKDFETEHYDELLAMSEMAKQNKNKDNYRTEDTSGKIHLGESKKNRKTKAISSKRKIPLDSRKPSASESDLRTRQRVPRKMTSHVISHSKIQKSTGKPEKKTKDVKRNKNLRKIPKAIGKKQNKNDNQSIALNSEKNAYGPENFAYLKEGLKSKDMLVLKWLHDLKCPAIDENDTKFNSEGKSHIQILKRPLNSKKRSKSTKKEPIRRPGLKGVHRQGKLHNEVKESTTKNKSRATKEVEESSSDGSIQSAGSNPLESHNKEGIDKQMDASDKIREHPAVDIQVTDSGKLQIIMNLKSISPEDAAVIVWLDDLPESIWKSGIQSSAKDIGTAERRRTVSEGSFAQNIEDLETPRPNIYFPPVTILRNVAVDSKAGLKSLKENLLNSVFYKRCNLRYADWETLKECA